MASVEKLDCCNVAITNLSPEDLSERILEVASSGKAEHIVLLSLWDLLRARKHNEYRTFVQQAAMVIPISKSIIGGLKFLHGKTVPRYMPFDFFIKTLHALESRGKSLYLLGGRPRTLKIAERNIRHTFPGLRIVGRCAGYYKKNEEAPILLAIKKSSPTLLLVGRGVPGDENWLVRNEASLGPGIHIWCSDLFDIFAERRHRPSRKAFNHGFEWVGYCLRNPLKLFRIFSYLKFKIILLYYKIRYY
ncbi:MAG: WecB/TagA/CpsF family glycosyltransferase [Treponemataceae bacterium]|nr:WecB/TagA/CpsF family glycosyltransferase [Treponemataceae bacterium]